MGAVPLGGTPADGTLAAVATIGIRHFPMAAPRKRYIRLARGRKGASSFFSCRTRVRSWHEPAHNRWAEHVRSAQVHQASTCSAIASASSTSMPRYRTVRVAGQELDGPKIACAPID